jgi:glutamate formiminotransferase
VTLLAVPNISEGRDHVLVDRIAGTELLLDVSSDVDHNRSVLTYGGSAEALADALYAMVDRAVTNLDIRTHDGVHPRFGVVDVLPIVPYGESEEAARSLITELTWRIAQGPGVTLFEYGDDKTLPQLRRELADSTEPQHPSAGVICVGIRGPLIAFNVNIDAPLVEAKRIANEVRTKEIRTLAFKLETRGLVQVSMNLTDPLHVGPRRAFEAVTEHTSAVVEVEVVGLVPEAVLAQFESLPMTSQVRSIEAALSG